MRICFTLRAARNPSICVLAWTPAPKTVTTEAFFVPGGPLPVRRAPVARQYYRFRPSTQAARRFPYPVPSQLPLDGAAALRIAILDRKNPQAQSVAVLQIGRYQHFQTRFRFHR